MLTWLFSAMQSLAPYADWRAYAAAAACGACAYALYKRLTSPRAPPRHGWSVRNHTQSRIHTFTRIPFIGCAIEFGKAPLSFIEECRQRYGRIFTLYVAGKHMTFLTDPDNHFPIFFESEPVVSFQYAVQPFTHKAGWSLQGIFLLWIYSYHGSRNPAKLVRQSSQGRTRCDERQACSGACREDAPGPCRQAPGNIRDCGGFL